MELTFSKSEDIYVAEVKVTGDFNLHIEGVVEGNVQVYQRGTETGGYALVREATLRPSYGNVYDMDFSAAVYPKYIRVVCPAQPTSATVTFNA